jgi:uncharacterized protein YbjT (DUF2867 family)
MSRTILVTGATGNQGSATIAGLLAQPNASEFSILAVTRTPSSESAQRLQKKYPAIKLISGNLDSPNDLFTTAGVPVWGIFSVQVFFGGGASIETEERQGKALVDSALEHDVKMFVYSSVDRGGSSSDTISSGVPHFESKAQIEKHLKAKAEGSPMQYTILRPVFFMDNISSDMIGKVTVATWRSYLDSRKQALQLIACADIGHFAAQAFAYPEKHASRAISLAGDKLTQVEAASIWKDETGQEMPIAWPVSIMAWLMLHAAKDITLMFKWFADTGYNADVASLRTEHPNLLDFRTWVRQNRT